MIERDKKRIKLNNKYAAKRSNLLKQYKETEDFKLRLEIHAKIQKLPRNSAKIRIRNRCWKTGRPRGFYRDFGLSRHVLREMAHTCLLPGKSPPVEASTAFPEKTKLPPKVLAPQGAATHLGKHVAPLCQKPIHANSLCLQFGRHRFGCPFDVPL